MDGRRCNEVSGYQISGSIVRVERLGECRRADTRRDNHNSNELFHGDTPSCF
jgi:hypothetical protein